jgi:hypothetical protein
LSNLKPCDLAGKNGLNAFISAFIGVCTTDNEWRRVHEKELNLEGQDIEFFCHLNSMVKKELVVEDTDEQGRFWELSPKMIAGLTSFLSMKMPIAR